MQFIRMRLATAFLMPLSLLATPVEAGPFDGTWTLSLYGGTTGCPEISGDRLTVTDGQVSGIVDSRRGPLVTRGEIANDGKVKFNLDHGLIAFKGKAEGSSTSGNWQTESGRCRGKFRMTRE